MQQEPLYYIWLSTVLYPGSPSAKLVLEGFPDISAVYHASYADYLAIGVGKGDAERMSDKSLMQAQRYYDYCQKEHIGLLCYDDPYYPGRLKAISDPPPLLYYRGRVNLLDDYPCFTMVGTRSCSEKGFRSAYRTAYKAACGGAVIVNGLALGADTACMRGALDAGGYAVGILGCGIDRIYPSQNEDLFCRLSRQGLILTEFAPFTRPEGRNFPVRNRVISGLSVATVIFEASAGSGALITASHALSQGRKLFAVPGDINDPLYEGPLGLIKDGAQAITDADDILAEYSLMFPHRIQMHPVHVPIHAENDAVASAFSVLTLEENAKAPQEPRLPKPPHANLHASKARGKNSSPAAAEKADVRGKRTAKAAVAETPKEGAFSDTQSPSSAPEKDTSMLSVQEQKLYALFLKRDILTVDEIAAQGLKVDDVLSSLTLLEVYGFVRMLPGGRYERL